MRMSLRPLPTGCLQEKSAFLDVEVVRNTVNIKPLVEYERLSWEEDDEKVAPSKPTQVLASTMADVVTWEDAEAFPWISTTSACRSKNPSRPCVDEQAGAPKATRRGPPWIAASQGSAAGPP